MMKVSKVFVALLVCVMMKKCLVCADSSSGSSGSSDDERGRSFVLCKLSVGGIGYVELCTGIENQCEVVDVNNDTLCLFVKGCPPSSTFTIEETGISVVARCNDQFEGGACLVRCYGTCGGEASQCAGPSIPSCGCEQPICSSFCTIP